MKPAQRAIEVFADWVGLQGPLRVGTLFVARAHAGEVFSFSYDEAWLKNQKWSAFDPHLQFFSGPQYAREGAPNFGVFLDSSPDRWGRLLMQRREDREARGEGRHKRKLLESDYLLGVHDSHRLGALRFKTALEGPFLDDRKALASPPLVRLRELEQASLKLERDVGQTDPDYDKWLRMLIAPGGSLGGARPKASVIDEQGQLWIAKFPSAADSRDVGAWEMVVRELAAAAGVEVAEARVRRFSRHQTFLVRRFDRLHAGRIHFASAMTLLGRKEGADAAGGASYLELADFIIRQGASPHRDLEQLWRRILFNVCVSNTDDHLRNHGFLLVPGQGWALSPAYDMNPVPDGEGLKLNISETDNDQDLSLVNEVAPLFRVPAARRVGIVNEVLSAVRQWRRVAAELSLGRAEQDEMAPAFRLAD